MTHYIHYGSDTYIPEIMIAKLNTEINKLNIYGKDYLSMYRKPEGLWASPIDASYGWKSFCKDAHLYKTDFAKYFKFRLSKKAKILHIHCLNDIRKYLTEGNVEGDKALNFKKIYHKFDGIEVHMSEHFGELRDQFYSWDCDSICIWNPNIIQVI